MIPFSRFSTLFHIIDRKSFRQEAGHLIVAISIFFTKFTFFISMKFKYNILQFCSCKNY